MKTLSDRMPNLAVASVMAGAIMTGGAAWAQDGAPIRLMPATPITVTPAAPVQPGYVRTTTDTLEYCKELLGRLDKLMRESRNSAATTARNLSEEGERLCQHGQTKGGILRLRQAYVLLNPAKPGN